MAEKKKRLSAVMNRISARSRIAVGQVFLLVSVLWLAMALGIVPNERSAVMAGRAKLCEAIAVNGSVFVERGQMSALEATLKAVLARDKTILSAAVRGEDGRAVVEVGDHSAHWGKLSGHAALESYIYVPIFTKDTNGELVKWGAVEVRFQPLSGDGWLGYVNTPQVRLMAFVASATMGLYLLYLRKMLQHLDPSKVVPSRVRSALDTLAEGLLVMDNDERVVLANQAFASIVGRSPDDLLGCKASGLPWVLEGTDGGAVYPWLDAIRERAPQKGVVVRLKDAAGERRTFTVNCSPVLGHDGKYRGVLASFDDVTRLEQKEIELRKSKDAAERYAAAAEAANRAKSDFLARMSHEIRTPMNAVLGFTDALRRGYESDEAERREYLNTIHASGQHLLELINDILDLSKIESGRLEVERATCSPHQLISEVVTVLRVRAKEKGIALDYAWDGGLPETVLTDPTRLRQALTNLVGNAIKFTEQGSVRVVARLVPGERGKSSVTPNGQPAANLAIDVIDTGIGMKPEALSRIFRPFAQADTSITRRFGGTGLGLSISRQLAELLGGGIAVQSEVGKGSTFTLTVDAGPLEGVPILSSMPAAAEAPSAAAERTTLRLPRARVLVVEDGVSNQKLISLVLTRAGLHVDMASDGKAGVEMATRGDYAVVLMDMQMPVMDGYTATTTLRRQGFTTPIIALTAHAMKGEEEKCRAAGCSGFLTKPIDIDLLLRTLADVLADGGGKDVGDVRGGQAGGGEAADRVADPGPPAVPAAVSAADGALVSSLPTDDPDFREIVIEFADRLGQQLAAIQSAWEQRELADVAKLAHWLKGSGGTAGFHAFTAPAAKLERNAKEARLEDIAASIAEVTALASRIVVPGAAATTGSDSETAGRSE